LHSLCENKVESSSKKYFLAVAKRLSATNISACEV
jgi:hypothetical protein